MQCHNAMQRHWWAQNMLVTPPKSWSKSDRKWSKVTKSDKKWAFTPFSRFEQIFLKKPSLNAQHYSVTMPCRGICVHRTWMWHIPKVGPKVIESDQKWQKVTKSENKTFTLFKKNPPSLKKTLPSFADTFIGVRSWWGTRALKKNITLFCRYLLGWELEGKAKWPFISKWQVATIALFQPVTFISMWQVGVSQNQPCFAVILQLAVLWPGVIVKIW